MKAGIAGPLRHGASVIAVLLFAVTGSKIMFPVNKEDFYFCFYGRRHYQLAV